MFKFDMIVHDSFFRLTERMIVHDGFSVSGGNKGGLTAIWLPHCHRPVKNNKAIIWTNIRTTVTLKVRKAKKSKKPGNEKCSGSLICNLIDTPLSRLSSVFILSSFLVCGGPATLHKCHPALQSLNVWLKLLFSADTQPFSSQNSMPRNICLQSHVVGD